MEQTLRTKILIVDDRRENLVSMAAVLDFPDVQCDLAQGGNEALIKVTEYSYACILMDVRMPDLTGYEVAKLIRLNPKLKETPIIFVTAEYSDIDSVAEGYLSGAIDYLIKPVNPLILRSKVRIFADLYQTSAELISATQVRSRFIAQMNHEIRTPLNAIIGLSTLLKDTQLSRDQTELVDIISSSSTRLLALANQVLDFSKIESGALTLNEVEFDLTQKLREEIRPFEFTAKQKGIEFISGVGDYPNLVIGDDNRICQIILNFVSNAIKFTKEGKVSVESKMSKRDDKVFVEISISDTGAGIPKEAHSKMFQPFSQAEISTYKKFGGTGLGLAISKELAELMGAKVSFESELGRGSTFKVEVLLSEGSKKAPPTSTKKQDPKLDAGKSVKATLLVTEDEPLNQVVIGRMLKKLGYEVEMVNNGAEAIERIKTKSFDLILMDCQMPGMDGYATTGMIRKTSGRYASVPIIACTAFATKEEQDKCLSSGMTDFVHKPVNIDELDRIIKKNLEKLYSNDKN
jgi:signal transduction histidine kinase